MDAGGNNGGGDSGKVAMMMMMMVIIILWDFIYEYIYQTNIFGYMHIGI